ncbi:type VII toxin-antitoxin system MntA family adenylyltransferase antitoxin [Nitratiruptor sp. SB155-2]|uniref:type VII toxin-antitoxin system MntA family adenylyltransferase antitoxin n=1 Tax=Nitratiruptor sp. (strain SB155-2) TaxID=387092 RepID=UPI0001586F19|nr:nucleotidyltransferase domain-containing protein [Nitratiruptor sp. SB155-2]BAF69255.1 nucleotidyltransferase [Nitratiruptor sp. SB155-2]
MKKHINPQKRIEEIVNYLKTYNPKKIILFGSHAKGYATKYSDIDIALEIPLDFRSKRKLKEEVDRLSGLLSVDIVFFNEADKNFKKQIEKEGKVLYEKE